MNFLTHVREAFANLHAAKLRSFLAILGVLVGTGSVVALISCSQLATAHALDQFKTLGTNLLAMSIESNASPTGGEKPKTLTMANVLEIKHASSQVTEIAPYTNLYMNFVFKGKQSSGEVLGATQQLANIAKIHIAKGRFVSILDKDSFYCVIGAKLAKSMYQQGISPLGKQILVGHYFFTIVGIASPWKPNLFVYADIDNGIIIPIETSFLIGVDVAINNILLRLVPKSNLTAVQNALKARTLEILPHVNIDFRNPEQIIAIVAKQRATFTYLLGAIGGIALIVGGIGVMNIMLVSVVERRREIGIRMAIGARPSDILKMFLIESVILTLFGGACGIFLGVAISYTLAVVTGWEFHLYILPILLGFVVSVLVGVLSGLYPSLQASMLDPIQTLQVE